MKPKREQLLYYAMKYQGEYAKIKKAIAVNEDYNLCTTESQYICIYDENYPKQLYELEFPPYVLFYKGDISLLKDALIGVIGSRNMSSIAKEYCELLEQHLHHKYTIVSGLAKGVDAYIHTCALSSRKTIGILGCGIDYIYPYENKVLYKEMEKHHLILSEYPGMTKPYAHHFPWRNRLLASLARKLIVVEAAKRSGTMLTVNEALILNRDIYCFPHTFLNPQGIGCNTLIREGAALLVDINDIIEL